MNSLENTFTSLFLSFCLAVAELVIFNFLLFRMPLLRVFSTLPEATFTDEKLAAASKMFSEAIKKPEKWCCVHIVPDQKMIFAGSRDPCAQIWIMSIGNLGPEDNIRITKES